MHPMKMTLEISEVDIANAIWRGNLNLPNIVRHLSACGTGAYDWQSLVNDFSDIGDYLSRAPAPAGLHGFGAALDALATDHHHEMLKGDTA